MSENQQRRDKRTDLTGESKTFVLPIFYQLLGTDGAPLDSEIRAAFTQDVSKSGMCLEIRHPPSVVKGVLLPQPKDGLRMELDLNLPHKRLRLNTRVAWVMPVLSQSHGKRPAMRKSE